MRNDMHRLVHVRTLDVTGQRKLLSRGTVRDLESLPTRQSMRAAVPHYSYPRVMKVNAATRWLHQQTNRPWDEVYAQMRERFDPRNLTQGSTLEHLMYEVERDVYFGDEGEPRVDGPYGSYAVGGLYVHPTTGMLLDAKRHEGAARKRAQARQAHTDSRSARRVVVSDTLQLHLLGNLWYWVELAPIFEAPKLVFKPVVSRITGDVLVEGHEEIDYARLCRDVLTGQDFLTVPKHRWETEPLMEAYGKPDHYAKRKWQASRRDLTRLGFH